MTLCHWVVGLGLSKELGAFIFMGLEAGPKPLKTELLSYF